MLVSSSGTATNLRLIINFIFTSFVSSLSLLASIISLHYSLLPKYISLLIFRIAEFACIISMGFPCRQFHDNWNSFFCNQWGLKCDNEGFLFTLDSGESFESEKSMLEEESVVLTLEAAAVFQVAQGLISSLTSAFFVQKCQSRTSVNS